MNCTGFAYNFGAKLCFMKALAVMNVTGHPVNSTDTSGRLVFKSDDSSSPCPAATPSLVASGVPWNGTTWSVCQRSAPGGDLLFTPASGTPVTIARSAEALYGEGTWLGLNVSDIKASPADLMGNKLLAQGNPTFAEIRAAAPPLVFSPPDALHGDPSHGNAHTFVGSRGSSTDVVFDVMGADILGEGHPGMGQTLSKYGRSFGIFKDKLIESQQREGLWGSYLPVVSIYYRMVTGGWIEMTAVPKADMGGSMEQRCFYRFQKVDGSGTT